MATRRSRMLGMGARLLTIGVLAYAVWDNSHKLPDDLESGEFLADTGSELRNLSAARYTVNVDGEEVQSGPWNLKLAVSGFGRSPFVNDRCLTVVDDAVAGTQYGDSGDWVVGGGDDKDKCKKGKMLGTSPVCTCQKDDTTWTGWAGKHCNVKVCADIVHDGVNSTTAYVHPRKKDSSEHDLPMINVPLLTSVTCILVCVLLGYKAIIAYFPNQEIDQSLRRRGIIVSPMVLEWGETLLIAALIACCLLTAQCMFLGIAQDPDLEHAISADDILKICFVTLILCNGFFTETSRGDSIASLSAGFIADATSALGTLYAIFYLSQQYQRMTQTQEYHAQPVYVGAVVFLSVHLATCVLASFPIISNNRGALALARLIKAPYQFLACFALSTLMCAYVTARRFQNVQDGVGAEAVGAYPSLSFQVGRQDDVCNFIGTEEQREDLAVDFTKLHGDCDGKDGSQSMWVWGCWALPLALHVLFVVVTRMREVSEVVDELRGAASKVTQSAGDLASGIAAGGEKTTFLPTRKNRYSRIRVETSV